MTEPAPTQQEIIDEYVREIMDKEPNMKQSEMRAMFACWAPTDIPRWFHVDHPGQPTPLWEAGSTDPVNIEEMRRFELKAQEFRYFAWRWYFADQMLEWRDK